jgi:hypothetical protein
MLVAFREAVAKRIGWLLEAAGLLVSLSGATLAMVFGRLMLAAVLAAVVLGFFLRLTGRRTRREPVPLPTPGWVYGLSALLSVVETAVLVEVTNLPVRFHQEGFALHHWALVLLAMAAAFVVQLPLLKALARKRQARKASSSLARKGDPGQGFEP